jgi:hypothetical protein
MERKITGDRFKAKSPAVVRHSPAEDPISPKSNEDLKARKQPRCRRSQGGETHARNRAAKRYSRPVERGLAPDGGDWNLRQASAWSSIGEHTLREMAKTGEIPCAYFIGRRIVLPRQGFIDWFNARGQTPPSAARRI